MSVQDSNEPTADSPPDTTVQQENTQPQPNDAPKPKTYQIARNADVLRLVALPKDGDVVVFESTDYHKTLLMLYLMQQTETEQKTEDEESQALLAHRRVLRDHLTFLINKVDRKKKKPLPREKSPVNTFGGTFDDILNHVAGGGGGKRKSQSEMAIINEVSMARDLLSAQLAAEEDDDEVEEDLLFEQVVKDEPLDEDDFITESPEANTIMGAMAGEVYKGETSPPAEERSPGAYNSIDMILEQISAVPTEGGAEYPETKKKERSRKSKGAVFAPRYNTAHVTINANPMTVQVAREPSPARFDGMNFLMDQISAAQSEQDKQNAAQATVKVEESFEINFDDPVPIAPSASSSSMFDTLDTSQGEASTSGATMDVEYNPEPGAPVYWNGFLVRDRISYEMLQRLYITSKHYVRANTILSLSDRGIIEKRIVTLFYLQIMMRVFPGDRPTRGYKEAAKVSWIERRFFEICPPRTPLHRENTWKMLGSHYHLRSKMVLDDFNGSVEVMKRVTETGDFDLFGGVSFEETRALIEEDDLQWAPPHQQLFDVPNAVKDVSMKVADLFPPRAKRGRPKKRKASSDDSDDDPDYSETESSTPKRRQAKGRDSAGTPTEKPEPSPLSLMKDFGYVTDFLYFKKLAQRHGLTKDLEESFEKRPKSDGMNAAELLEDGGASSSTASAAGLTDAAVEAITIFAEQQMHHKAKAPLTDEFVKEIFEYVERTCNERTVDPDEFVANKSLTSMGPVSFLAYERYLRKATLLFCEMYEYIHRSESYKLHDRFKSAFIREKLFHYCPFPKVKTESSVYTNVIARAKADGAMILADKKHFESLFPHAWR